MKKALSAGLNVYFFARNLQRIRKASFVSIEDMIFGHNIFGHAILEKIDPSKYTFPIYLISSNKKASGVYANLVLNRAVSRGFFVDENLRRAYHGNLFLSKRLGCKNEFKFMETSGNFTHKVLADLAPISKLTTEAGIPKFLKSQRYITLMNRSHSYKKINEDSHVHDHRNFEFEKLGKAVESLEDTTFKFVRIGTCDDSLDSYKKIYDLRQDLTRNKELDVIIQEHAFAYFGADSGPVWIPMSQGKPVGLIDVIPLGNPFPTQPSKVLCLPKSIYDTNQKRLLNIRELSSEFIRRLTCKEEYRVNGLEVIDNPEDEVIEFLDFWIKNIVKSNIEATDQINSYMTALREKENLPDLPSIYFKELLNG